MPSQTFLQGRYHRRKSLNSVMMGLCAFSALVGIACLALILAVLAWNGFAHLSPAVLFQDTPAVDSPGGLRNAIVGSLIITFIGVAIGTPIGILAGTYMSEYGSVSKIASIIRFVNDILLSAPSIIIGLFIYQFVVVPMGYSAFAGSLALAVIIIPVVVRTTEDMLRLVPNPLREAASALGLPRSHVVLKVAYRAAKSGIITGILLAVARASGETAPLLFTSLSDQFFNLNIFKPMASLPVVINNFAGKGYVNWDELAWTGALLITLAVLTLSIGARILSTQKAGK